MNQENDAQAQQLEIAIRALHVIAVMAEMESKQIRNCFRCFTRDGDIWVDVRYV